MAVGWPIFSVLPYKEALMGPFLKEMVMLRLWMAAVVA